MQIANVTSLMHCAEMNALFRSIKHVRNGAANP